MIGILISLLIVCILAALAYYVATLLPEPARKIVTVVIVVIVVIYIVWMLLPLTAHAPLLRR
jgi:hypothetical protein